LKKHTPMQKSIPLFYDIKPPSSTVAKRLLREILSEDLQPLTSEEIKQLKKQYKTRIRVYLTQEDQDLIDFLSSAPLSVQYAVFKKFNEKLPTGCPAGGEAKRPFIYSIATYIKKEHLERFGRHFQEIGRKVVQEVLKMKEDDILNVPTEKIEEVLEDAVLRRIYLDRETHERWIAFSKRFKKWLHFWINEKLATIKVPATEREKPISGFWIDKKLATIEVSATKREKPSSGRESVLAFYLYGPIYELYKQGFLNSKVVLDCLTEVYQDKDKIKPMRQVEYKKIKKKLGTAGKVLVNFKHHPELRDWYVDTPLPKRRGIWVAVHQKILNKLANLLANL